MYLQNVSSDVISQCNLQKSIFQCNHPVWQGAAGNRQIGALFLAPNEILWSWEGNLLKKDALCRWSWLFGFLIDLSNFTLIRLISLLSKRLPKAIKTAERSERRKVYTLWSTQIVDSKFSLTNLFFSNFFIWFLRDNTELTPTPRYRFQFLPANCFEIFFELSEFFASKLFRFNFSM